MKILDNFFNGIIIEMQEQFAALKKKILNEYTVYAEQIKRTRNLLDAYEQFDITKHLLSSIQTYKGKGIDPLQKDISRIVNEEYHVNEVKI